MSGMRHSAPISSLAVLALCAPCAAQPEPRPQAVPDTQPAPLPTTRPAAECREKGKEKAKPLRGPKYERNRANDDFSYLDGPPGSYQPDFFDPIKRIHIGDDVIVRLGGDTRGRFEDVAHRRFGLNESSSHLRGQIPRHDDYFLHHYYYHADIEYRKLARFYIEGVHALIEDRDRNTPVASPEDRFDAHQMFFDLRFLGEDVPLTLRFGRQELYYGNQRLVSSGYWSNVRRVWDAVKVFWDSEHLRIDAFYARPVRLFPRRPDWYDPTISLYGLYNTYRFDKDHGIDAYFFALENVGAYTNANYTTGDIGDLSNYTMGTRVWGADKLGPGLIDYENELAGQWGKAADDTIQAWMWALYGGYTQTKWPWKPRLGFGVDYASGDEDPFDYVHQTWNQLYPAAHNWLGYLDQIGRQNLWSENVNLTLQPTDKITTQVFWYDYALVHTKDALYDKLGGPIRRFPYGGVGSQVGNELDFTLTWQLTPHASLLFGYSHLWTSKSFFNHRNQPKEDPDLIYFQYEYKF